MFILHTISSIDLSAGGPSKSVSDLSCHLAQRGLEINIIANESPNPYLKISPIENLNLNFVNNHSFKQALKNIFSKKKIDLLHGHGLWQMPIHQMALLARRNNIPYIISPRGMLEPWALNAKKWKKKLALWLYQKKDLAQAACIHATGQMEADQILRLGFKNHIAIIPNGINLSEFPLWEQKQENSKRTILFLSRIHPKKGIELLIEAWQQIDINLRQNWQIEIAGNGAKSYIASLQKLIDTKGLANEISIIGPQFGEAKLAAYNRANIFVLPTHSENFGIVVAEALACGVPVITTKGTPWEELNTCNAGWWIDIGVDPLVNALKQAIQLSDTERQLMGQNGRKLVEENYSIESVAQKMSQLYEWILKGGEKPEFVNKFHN